jgi:hypothetical protein
MGLSLACWGNLRKPSSTATVIKSLRDCKKLRYTPPAKNSIFIVDRRLFG